MPFYKGDRIVFLHAEKTGGTSLHHVLSDLFEPDKICPERFEQISLLPVNTLEKYEFFSAHATLEDFRDVPKPFKLITILRDPLERTISLYDFWRSIKPEIIQARNLYGPRLAQNLAPAEFFAPHNNWRTKATNRYAELLTKKAASRSGEELLDNFETRAEIAIRALDQFDFIAFSEDLDGSFDRLSQVFDIPGRGKIPRLNVTNLNPIDGAETFERKPDVAIDNELFDLIELLNRSDQLIYDYAVRRYFPGGHLIRKLILQAATGSTVRPGRDADWCSIVGQGCLLHGPYCRFRPGSYKAILTTNLRSGLEGEIDQARKISFDVTSDLGNSIISEIDVPIGAAIGGQVEISFCLPEFKRDIELRVHVENFPEIEFSTFVSVEIDRKY